MVLKCKHYNETSGESCKGDFSKCATDIDCPDDKPQTCYGVYDTAMNIKNAGCIDTTEYDDRCLNQCVGQKKGKFHYCCCVEDYCNSNYVSPPPPPPTKAPTTTVRPQISTYSSSSQAPKLTWLILPIPFIIIVLLVVANIIYRRRRSGSRSRTGEEGMNELDNLRDNQEGDAAVQICVSDQQSSSKFPPKSFNGKNTSVKYNSVGAEDDNVSINQENDATKKPKGTNVQTEDNQSPNRKNNRSKLGQVFPPSDQPLYDLPASTFEGVDNHSKDNRDSIRNYIKGIDTKNTKVLEEIGSGRYGTIRKALLTDGSEKIVAVKMLHASLRETWINEVEIFSCDKIKHPNIIGFLGSHKVRDKEAISYWLTLEYAANGSLYNYLQNNTVNWDEFLKIAMGIANGLSHLHDYDVAHRDFKSKNVLLKDDLTPCVSDFGVASILGRILGPRIEPGKRVLQVGTPRYMSPEVLECSVTFTKTSFTKIDVYAMSLVLWELISRCHQLKPGPARERPNLSTGNNSDVSGKEGSVELLPPHMLPFEDIVGTNPTVSRMREVVVAEKMRPPIKPQWREYPLSEFCRALEDAWEYDHDARISASCFVERLGFMQKQAAYILARANHQYGR